MSSIIWISVGILVGWLSYSVVRFNRGRGPAVSIILGAGGALLGGEVMGPLMASNVHAGDFDPIALFMAAAMAAICVILGNWVCGRLDA